MRTLGVASVVLLAGMVFVLGCGQKASTDQPIEQVKAEAEKLSADGLKAKVETYNAEIAKCRTRLSELAEQLKKVTNPLSEEATKIAKESSEVTTTIAKLQERLTIYANELAKKAQ